MPIIKKYKYIITIILAFLLLTITIVIKCNLNKKKYELTPDDELEFAQSPSPSPCQNDSKMCTVDIKGAINKPGIYTVECNKYINDIIIMAEGLTKNADTSSINLAKRITDEMVIIIYTKEEINNFKVKEDINKEIDNSCICPTIKNDAKISLDDTSKNETAKLININKATIEELKSLPGIGNAKAQAIIDYRTNFGPFKTINDIKNVSGIGAKLYEEIKVFITT